MNGLDLFEEDEGNTVFRDVIMLALLGFVAIVVLLLPHLNPPAKAVEAAVPPGNVIVEVRWPDDRDTDVDLWVQAPGDVPVGYSNQSGLVFNMLRDDRGRQGDLSGLNYEAAYSRGAPAGAYTVNLHLYADSDGRLPITVAVVVSLRTSNRGVVRRIASREVALTRVGEERTIVRFTLDERHRLVPGSVHDLPKPLRSASSQSASRSPDL